MVRPSFDRERLYCCCRLRSIPDVVEFAGVGCPAAVPTDARFHYCLSFPKSWSATPPSCEERKAPDAPVISSPADNSNNVTGNVTVSGTAEPGSTVEIFDATTSKGTTQANSSGNWSKALTGVTDGSHTYTAKATDAVGNTSVASNARTVIVDTTPDTTITSGPSGSVNTNSASFGFSSSEAGSTFECSLDGGNYSACTSPKDYTALSDGSHTFQVRATGVAGHVGPTTSRSWTVDTTLPNAIIDSGPSGDVNSASANFTFSSDGSSFVCSLDGSAYSECFSPRSYFSLGDGTHTFRVKATDVAGNQNPAERTWTVDTVKPSGEIVVNGGKAYTKSTSVTLSLSATDPSPASGVSSMRFMNDGGSWSGWQTYATSKSWTLRKATGLRTVYVQYQDKAGNVSTTASDTITLDTVKPTISGMSPRSGSTITDTSPKIKATVKDNLTNLQKSNIKLYVNGSLISATKYSYSASTDVLTYFSETLEGQEDGEDSSDRRRRQRGREVLVLHHQVVRRLAVVTLSTRGLLILRRH